MWRIGQRLPARLSYFTTGFISRLSTQFAQRRMARALVREHGITVVHQPMPVSPKEPSLLHGLGAPVVIGPMNGGMAYPPGFEKGGLRMVSALEGLGRATARWMNWLMPGKRHAALLLVANQRTRRALPGGLVAPVIELPENGVDLQLWAPQVGAEVPQGAGDVTRFIFMGRLVDWKAVDLLLKAMSKAASRGAMSLTVVGDGPQGPALQDLARQLGLLAEQPGQAGKVHFAGWKTQLECAGLLRQHDALVLPSLWECGGAVVLEAMACGLPVLATDWGGPADYLDATCGILVPPQSPEQLIAGLAEGLQRLAASPELRRQLGQAGRRRVEAEFDWDKKLEQMLKIYEQAMTHAPAVPANR
jgi:glycosyltransferase involved in cell wall biosynthesis